MSQPTSKRKRTQFPPLESRLVLHRFICSEFGYSDMRAMLAEFSELRLERQSDDHHPVLDRIAVRADLAISPNKLEAYGSNIRIHSDNLKMGAGQNHEWKPHQYLSLLLTERYLDCWFEDKEDLLHRLNHFRQENFADVPEYKLAELTTIAFQSATGSGKTIMMHAHLQQFQDYARQHNHKINNIYLITPDADMSAQHLHEMQRSGIAAELFQKDRSPSLSGLTPVQIIDIHKLGDETKEVVIDVNELGNRNLVLVDEGHLGKEGAKSITRERRNQLANDGFTLEYSATFNQVAKDDLLDHYGKCLLFDYSYRHFYHDGYGKDHSIANLGKGLHDENPRIYQVGCMLVFYQQMKIFEELGSSWADYNITRPLWVMLGNTVVTAQGKLSLGARTDVVEVIHFLHWVLCQRKEVKEDISTILSGQVEFIMEESKQDWFADKFDWLKSQKMSPAKIYDDLCTLLFHGTGSLHVTYLTQGAGEIHLASSEGGTVFGVINIGAPAEVYKLITNDELHIATLRDTGFAKRLFSDVDDPTSKVTTLIGARKFIAGWNSWRVSTMTLMNVGQRQGAQIIQMFGRGVRLKGLGFSLKRHTSLTGTAAPENSQQLALLETLNIYGLKANYMKTFSEIIAKEGIQTEHRTFTIPVRAQLPKGLQLPLLRTKAGKFFEKDGGSVAIDANDPRYKAKLSLYSHIQTMGGKVDGTAKVEQEIQYFRKEKPIFNKRRIYQALVAFKERHKMHNLALQPEFIDELLANNNWYELYAPPGKIKLNSMADVHKQEDRFIDLACRLLQENWKNESWLWEKDHKDIVPLGKKDAGIIDSYTLFIDENELKKEDREEDISTLLEDIGNLCDQLEERKIDSLGLEILMPSQHAYIPIICQSDKSPVVVKPLPLNDGEKKTVTQLMSLVDQPLLADYELYLLRNASRTGTGFFGKNGFYPDFICWLIKKDQSETHIIFLDPKGMVHGDNQAKIDLHNSIKDIEKCLRNKKIHLHSYILSVSADIQASPDNGVYKLKGNQNCLKEVLSHALGQ